jgi:uncharacterized protein (UPF0332 family)
MLNARSIFLEKALESLEGAASEFTNHRYNNCANRCYYACFQAAIHALLEAGIRPSGGQAEWSHGFVQAQFVGQLINRRKVYPASLRDVLSRAIFLRGTADYRGDHVSEAQAFRALRGTRQFVEAVQRRGGEDR